MISLSLVSDLTTVRVHVHPCKANFNSQLYSVIFSLEIIFCTIPKAEAVKLGQGLSRPSHSTHRRGLGLSHTRAPCHRKICDICEDIFCSQTLSECAAALQYMQYTSIKSCQDLFLLNNVHLGWIERDPLEKKETRSGSDEISFTLSQMTISLDDSQATVTIKQVS